MATMTATILFFIILCNLASGSGDASIGQSCAGEITWAQAENCCREIKGNLGSVENKTEMSWLLEYMTRYNMTSSWVNVRKREMKKWRWIDGESGDFGGFIEERKTNGSCVWFNQKTRRLEPGRCSDRTVGSICQINDPICKEFHRRWIGREHNGICYLHFCERLSWHEARAYCHTWGLGYTMALVKQRDTMDALARHKWGCDRFWVGLRKEEWLEDNDRPVDMIYKKWNTDETKDIGRCGQVRIHQSTLIFEPKPCHTAVSYMCLNLQNGTIPKPQRMTSHNTAIFVGCSIGSLAAVFIFLASMFLWRRKRNRAWRTGRQSKQKEDPEKIPLQKAGSQVFRLQQKMAGIILQFYKKINMCTLHSYHQLPMEDQYVNLTLVEDKQCNVGKEEYVTSYRDIFKEVGNRSTIYLSGDPGVGKSTFTRHLCFEWAKIHEKGDDMERQFRDTFDNYQFVLPIFLRDIKREDSICDVFTKAYQLGWEEAKELFDHIDRTDKPVLIIADGLDEYSDSTSKDITELLHRKLFPRITLLIASRFPAQTYFSESELRPDILIILRGFSQAGVKEYLRKFFKQNKGKRDALLKEISQSKELAHLSRYPAILLMTATLWEKESKLPRTITTFYEEFVAHMFALMEKKQPKPERAKSTKDIFKKYRKQFMALGYLATGNVKTHKLEMKFKSEDVEKLIIPDCLKTGILIAKHTFLEDKFYIFIHKTLQEFFLAFYLVNVKCSKQKELLVLFFNSRQAFNEYAMILKFVSGLGGEKIYRQVELLIEGNESDVADMHTSLQLEYLAEHPNANLTLPPLVGLHFNKNHPGSHYVKFLRQDGKEIRKMWLMSREMKHFRLLQNVDAPNLRSLVFYLWFNTGSPCTIEKKHFTQAHDMTLTKFPLEELKVHHIRDESEISALIRAVVQIVTLRRLELFRTPLKEESLQRLSHRLPGSQLESLRLSDCGLKPSGVFAVITAAPKTLTDLDVSGNSQIEERGDELVKVTDMTTQLEKLKKLNLENSLIQLPNVEIIKKRLKEACPHLELVIDGQGYTVY